MPDIPEKQSELDPITHHQAKQATSKPYRGSTVSTKEYMKLPWQEQRRLDAQIEEQQALKYRTVKPLDGPAYQVGYTDTQSGDR